MERHSDTTLSRQRRTLSSAVLSGCRSKVLQVQLLPINPVPCTLKLGMFPLPLTILHGDYSTPLVESLLRTVSIRANIPTLYPQP